MESWKGDCNVLQYLAKSIDICKLYTIIFFDTYTYPAISSTLYLLVMYSAWWGWGWGWVKKSARTLSYLDSKFERVGMQNKSCHAKQGLELSSMSSPRKKKPGYLFICLFVRFLAHHSSHTRS